LIIGLLLSLAPIRAVAGGEERSAANIRFLRVLAPEDRMKDWPLGGEKYLPIAADEFERLLAAMKPQDARSPRILPAAVVSARYAAKLVGDRLVGDATFGVTLAGRSPAFLPLAHCNLAIGSGEWRVESGEKEPLPPSALRPPPSAFRPPPSASLQISKTPNRAAAIGSGSDGRLGVFVERSDRLSVEWSLAGQRDSSDVLAFSFEIPAAASNQVFLELPNALTPKVDRGLVLGSKAADERSRRWQIELGGNDRLRLQLVPAGNAHQRRQLALLRESRAYDCSLRALEVSAQWKLQVYNEPLERVGVLLDPGLQLVSARLGDVAIPWSAAAMADGGTRLTLRLPEPIRDTDRVIRLAATGRPALDRPWRLPRIRAERLLWLEGSISLLAPEPLAADRVVPLHCAQTGVGPLSAPRSGQSMQFQSFDRDATVEVSLSRPPAKVEALAGAAIELDGQQATARVAAHLHISNDTRFAIEADVTPRWMIDAVESVPPGGVADWSVEPRSNGRQRLMIQLAAGLSPQQPLQLAIAARRRFAASDERLNSGDLPPLRFRGLAHCKQLVSVRPIGAFAMKIRGDERLKRLEPDELVPSESALLAAKPHDLLFERDQRSDSLSLSLVTRESRHAGLPSRDVSARDRKLREKSLPHVPRSDRASTSREPVAAAAWIGDCRLESWHHSDGTVRNSASYNLENAGCNRLRLAMPPEIAGDEVRGVRIDGVPAAWQMETAVSGTRRVPKADGSRRVPDTVMSVELPAGRKSLCLTVEWTACGPPLGIVGSLAASLPEPDVPVLARHWIAWLPPGYESVGSEGYAPSADEATSAGMQGWIGRCIDVPAGTPVALRYARAASMQLLGAVVFLLAAGLGCWTAKRRAAAALALLLAGFAAAAMVLPDAYVPVAWGGLLGVLFCLALRWVHRDRPPSVPSSDANNPTTDANSAGAMSPIGTLLSLVLCGAAVSAAHVGVAVALPPPTQDAATVDRAVAAPQPRVRGGSTTATPTAPAIAAPTRAGETPAPQSSPPLPSVDGKVSAAARPASSPVYRVFVPVDARQKPVGGKVYLPEAFYQELYRHAAPVEKPPAWMILGAVYRGDLTKDTVSGRLAVGGLRAQYDLRVFERATRVRIPLRTEGVNLLPDSVLLDGRPIEPEWEPDGRALAFDVAEPGDYRLGLSLRPAVRAAAGSGGFDMAIPRVASSRLDLALPADAPPVEVLSACGGVSLEKAPPRLLAELGPTDRLTVRWQESATSRAQVAVNAEQLTWLKIQPGSVMVNAKFKFHVAEGELRQVQLAVDPRLRLLPLSGDAQPTVQVGTESGQTRLITFRWPRPIAGDAVLEAALLFNGASAVGNIPLPRIELVDFRPTRRWMAVSVDAALDCEEQDGERLEPLPVADFLKAWGPCESRPRAAYRLPRGESAWTLATRPHEPRTTAGQTLSLSFDEDRIDVVFDARLSIASGYVFQQQVTAPKDFEIERVSLVVDRDDHVQRWAQDKEGTITVFLDGPASGAARLSIRGRLPIRMGQPCELPLFAVQNCRMQTVVIQLWERPAVSLTFPSAGVSSTPRRPAVSSAPKAAGETSALQMPRTPESGRLVDTIVWDGVRRPTVTVTARRNRREPDTTHKVTESHAGANSPNISMSGKAKPTARTPGYVHLADVAILWQNGDRWCGVATLDVFPGGAEHFDLRLPPGYELIQASVEDTPIVPKRVGDGLWRFASASSEAPQRIGVVYRGTSAGYTPDCLYCELPMLNDLPVRRTLWTAFLPPSLTAKSVGRPASVERRPSGISCPSNIAALHATFPPRYYLCEGVGAPLFLECRPLPPPRPFHRWAAAVLLFGTVLAGFLGIRVRLGRL
jgi:hypothetical protein